MARDKVSDLLAVFRREYRAGDVGDPAARLYQGSGAVQHLDLVLQPHLERPREYPPFGVGIAAPGAGSRAGRVDQDQIGGGPDIGERIVLAFGGADIGVMDAGAGQSLVDRGELPLVVIGRDQPALALHHRGNRERLAAGAGTEGDHLLAGVWRRKQRRELRAFVLHFDGALDKILLGMNAGIARVGAELDAKPERRPWRRLRTEMS